MQQLRQNFLDLFREQAVFATGYSPLYTQIFTIVASWLETAPEDDPFIVWFLDVVRDRAPLDVTLLLAAGLHRSVLAGDPQAADLARYYPTVGGTVPSPGDPGLEAALQAAILAQQTQLEPFLREATVQTNETARGLAWLWPLAQTAWPKVQLLDLGASAGLNLFGEKRAYRVVEKANPNEVLLDLGQAPPTQFIVPISGELGLPGRQTDPPTIAARTGIDLAPFYLHDEQDELTLASFIWGDQPVRLQRLREGIRALREAEEQGDVVRLFPVRLPDELETFLSTTWTPLPDLPIVIYNTTVTMYLEGGKQGVHDVLAPWAQNQPVPVLWLQWEPANAEEGESPDTYWLAWTADLWRDGRHHHFHLAWVHPHAAGLQWLPDAAEWTKLAGKMH